MKQDHLFAHYASSCWNSDRQLSDCVINETRSMCIELYYFTDMSPAGRLYKNVCHANYYVRGGKPFVQIKCSISTRLLPLITIPIIAWCKSNGSNNILTRTEEINKNKKNNQKIYFNRQYNVQVWIKSGQTEIATLAYIYYRSMCMTFILNSKNSFKVGQSSRPPASRIYVFFPAKHTRPRAGCCFEIEAS